MSLKDELNKRRQVEATMRSNERVRMREDLVRLDKFINESDLNFREIGISSFGIIETKNVIRLGLNITAKLMTWDVFTLDAEPTETSGSYRVKLTKTRGDSFSVIVDQEVTLDEFGELMLICRLKVPE